MGGHPVNRSGCVVVYRNELSRRTLLVFEVECVRLAGRLLGSARRYLAFEGRFQKYKILFFLMYSFSKFTVNYKL